MCIKSISAPNLSSVRWVIWGNAAGGRRLIDASLPQRPRCVRFVVQRGKGCPELGMDVVGRTDIRMRFTGGEPSAMNALIYPWLACI